jgi:prepilin-type N-terminal cleavage/methylation domain-containing protein
LKRAKAFSLVEVLLALALSAMLLAAVAAAMDASFWSYDQNERICDTTQTARAVLGRMANDIRTADAVTTSAGKITIIPPANGQGLTLIEYVFANGALTMNRTVNGVVTICPLLDNTGDVRVSGFTISSTQGLDYQGVTCTRSVTAHLTMTDGNQQFAVTASASPRRNQSF